MPAKVFPLAFFSILAANKPASELLLGYAVLVFIVWQVAFSFVPSSVCVCDWICACVFDISECRRKGKNQWRVWSDDEECLLGVWRSIHHVGRCFVAVSPLTTDPCFSLMCLSVCYNNDLFVGIRSYCLVETRFASSLYFKTSFKQSGQKIV